MVGRYYLTNIASYPAPASRRLWSCARPLELCGGGRVAQLINDVAGETRRKSFVFTTAGIVPTTIQTCESVANDVAIPFLRSYTATATTLSFYAAAPYVFSATYTKQ